MAIQNFIYFASSISFFIGAIFGIIKFDTLTNMLLGAAISGFSLFLILGFCSVFVLKYMQDYVTEQEKEVYETILDEHKININKKYTRFQDTVAEIKALGVKEILAQESKEKPIRKRGTIG